MGQAKIGAKIVLEGESEYRNALKNISAAQKENRSEMKLWSVEFKNNQESTEALTKKYELLTKQLEIQKQKVEANETVLTKNIKAEENAAQKVEELQTAYNNAAKEMEKMQSNSDTTTEALEEQKKKVEDLKGKLELAESGYDATARKVTQYKTSLNFAQAEQRAIENEIKSTEESLKEARTATDANTTAVDQYGKEVQEASKETSVFGDVLKANLVSDAIKTGITQIAEGVKGIAESATDTGLSFEAAMSQVAATMGMTADEVANGSDAYVLLADAAKKCGAETMFSASEAAEALNYLALAGYDAEKAAATLPKVLDLAAAGGLDLAYASDLVTDSMAAMSMETSELDNYIDEMARTSQKSNTSVAQLGEATLVCAGTVTMAGQSLETMNTELGVLANNGIKGAEGGTHLRNIILSLSAPTNTASNAIKSLGLEIADSQGNMRDMNDIMVDMNAALSGMSSTEKTKIISKIFNKTDIAAVNALLKGTGDEYNNLNKEIKNCSGAASDMAKTLNNNLKGRVDELESALEGLGISAYEIFDDTMKEAVGAATDAVGELQKSIDDGDLGVSLNKMAKAMGEFAEEAIDVGADVLPVVIDGFTWILDNSDLIISGIAGITAANIEMKVVAPAVEAVTASWTAYKTSTEGATVAQWLLNKAISANPAGLLITGIVGITTAVVTYAATIKESNSEIAKCNEETKKAIESAKTFNETTQASIASREQERTEMDAQVAVCKKLADELKTLQSKTSLTATEELRQKSIIDQLNTALPELNLAIDEQTGLLNMSTAELTENIDTMMAYAKAQAAREKLTEISKEQLNAEIELAGLQKQMEDQTNALTAADERLTEAAENLSETNSQSVEDWEKANSEMEDAVAYQEDLQVKINETEKTIADLAQDYEITCELVEESTEDMAASTATVTTATQELGSAAETSGSQLVTMSAEAQQAYQEMAEDLNELITEQMNLFTEFNAKSELSTEQLLSNMESQVTGISQWSDNIKELADRGIEKGLLKTLADMGPEGAGYVATFVSMTDEELQKANDLYKESLKLPSEATDEIMQSYMDVGTKSGEGFTTGVSDMQEEANQAVEDFGSGVLRTMERTLGIESYSKETVGDGEAFDEGLGVGIKKGEPLVLDNIKTLCGAMFNTTQNGLQTKSYEPIGKKLPEGLGGGIRDGEEDVLEAVGDVCTAAYEKAKKELERINTLLRTGISATNSLSSQMVNVNSMIIYSLPETAMGIGNNMQKNAAEMKTSESDIKRSIDISQNINIYAAQEDIIEAAAKFKKAQREAAEEW